VKKYKLMLTMSLILGITVGGSKVLAASNPTMIRLSGADRYATSKAIVENGWTSSADTVILAN
jgi:hypothetical protein